MGKYIDGSGLSHFMGIVKGYFAAKGEAISNISRSGTTFTATRADGTSFTFTQQDTAVSKTTTVPAMDGVAAIGSETAYAAGDHVHPSDTTRVPVTRTVNGKALSADITLLGGDISYNGGNTVADAIDDLTEELNDVAARKHFGKVKVGSTTIIADDYTDTLELFAGSNVTLTPDATNDKVTIAAANTTYNDFTSSTSSAAGTHGLVPAPPSGHTNWVLGSDAAWKGVGTAIYEATGAESGILMVLEPSNTNPPQEEVPIEALSPSTFITWLGNTAVNRATADASGNNIASTYATKNELGAATAGALQYKGTVSSESTITGASYKKGWYYVVSTAGTYLGKACEVGDMLIAKQDKTSTPANDWDAVQSNIEIMSNSEIDALWAAA